MESIKTVSFRVETKKINKLDSLAALQHRDRTYLLNEALDRYLEINQYHLEQIREGLKQAKAGKLIEHSTMKHRIAGWRSR